MKTLRFALMAFALYFSAGASAQTVMPCSTTEYTDQFLANDPEYIQNQAILEEATRQYILERQSGKTAEAGDVKVIPIVFHVIHNYGAENIDKQRIIEQVAILNRDFRRLNPDTTQTNPIYKGRGADTKIEFRLAQIDPNGNCTDGIVRVVSKLTYDAGNDVKALSYWPNNKYFNVWVVQTINGAPAGSVILGRSQFPGGSNLTDGVLMRSEVIGNTSSFNNHGRTLVHEIGHSMNLRHIWGDANCGNDFVDDTPPHTGANNGCPNNKKSICNGDTSIDMDENYMDYTDGNCQNMFSLGQNDRIQATINSSTNGRNNLWTQANLEATGTDSDYVAVLCSPKADFTGPSSVCQFSPVAFKDQSWGGQASGWEWTFEGTTQPTYTVQNPTVTFDSAGTFKVKLKVMNATGGDSIEKTNYITVIMDSSAIFGPYSEGIESPGFPDNGWRLISDDLRVWERTTAAAYSGSASIYIKNYSGNVSGNVDAFISPAINLSNATSATLKFRAAHAQRSATSDDMLTVSVSKTCGKSYILKFNKSGSALATAGIKTTNYVPASVSEWAEYSVPLTNVIGSPNALIKFEGISDGGNNIYIDDIQISGSFTNGLDQFMADNIDFSIAPNPVEATTSVRFFLINQAKVKLSLYDVIGREIATVADAEMGFGEQETTFDASRLGLSNGVYFLQLKVDNSIFTQKILVNN